MTYFVLNYCLSFDRCGNRNLVVAEYLGYHWAAERFDILALYDQTWDKFQVFAWIREDGHPQYLARMVEPFEVVLYESVRVLVVLVHGHIADIDRVSEAVTGVQELRMSIS
jgi:hypothetical protein